jgi:hypothetical protein
MRKLIAIALLLLSTPALAAGLLKGDAAPSYDRGPVKNWTGMYVGAWGSCGTGSGELNLFSPGTPDTPATLDQDGKPIPDTVVPGTPDHNLNVDGITFHGCGVAAQAGADMQMGDRIVIGLGIDYEMSNASGEVSQIAEWTRGDLWTIYGRTGVLMGPDSLLYVLGGYGQLDGGKFKLGSQSMDLPSRDAYTVGVGFEQRFANGQASVKLEYRHREYSDEVLHAWEDGSRLSGGASEDAGLVGIVWRLR